MQKINGLVLFDFDGTLTKKDSFILFIIYSAGWIKTILTGIVYLPVILSYLAGFSTGEYLKKKLLSWFFKGKSKEELFRLGEQFIDYLFQNNYFNVPIISKLENYLKAGDKVVVVSASPDIWVLPFCNKFFINCICTELLFINDHFTGNFKTKNCNNDEKKNRVLDKYNLNEFSFIACYGNSKNDGPLMSVASEKYFV